MNNRICFIKRTFDKNAIIVFIDLLGTCAFSEASTTESQAEKHLHALLSEFDIEFSEHFTEKEVINNFDVSIFADSIVVNQRVKTEGVVERLANFLLKYQINILLNQKIQSRAIITLGSFFSFKICRENISPKSILASEFTNIGLCGGHGVIKADKELKGLPLGVYVSEDLRNNLIIAQQASLLPVAGKKLHFLKQIGENNFAPFLADSAIEKLRSYPEISENDIRSAISESYSGIELEKIFPWILANMGKLKKIQPTVGEKFNKNNICYVQGE